MEESGSKGLRVVERSIKKKKPFSLRLFEEFFSKCLDSF